MISYENKTHICIWHHPKSKRWRVLSFQIQGHLTQGCRWNGPKYSKARWFRLKSEGFQRMKTASVFCVCFFKSHLTCCKSNPLSFPVKWVYRTYGTCWLWGILQRQICWWRILCTFPYFLLQIYYFLLLKYFFAENEVSIKPKPQSLYFIFEHISRHWKEMLKHLFFFNQSITKNLNFPRHQL